MKANLLIGTLFSALVALNCGGGTDPSRCTANSQCAAGTYCDPMLGTCVTPGGSSVATDGGAGGGSGFGKLPGVGGTGGGSAVPTNKIGAKCSAHADCGAGGTCGQSDKVSGGICSVSCRTTSDGVVSADPKLCPQGSVCDDYFKECFVPCTKGTTCSRPDFQCQQINSTITTCVPEIPELANWLFVGDRCTTSSQCATGTKKGECVTEWPGGYCTGPCSVDADCSYVDKCMSFKNPDTQATTNFCAARCYQPGKKASCRDGYVCRGYTGSTTYEGICTPE